MGADDHRPPANVRRVRLTAEERALLRRICQRHRRTLPPYLHSSRQELSLVAALLEKLAERD